MINCVGATSRSGGVGVQHNIAMASITAGLTCITKYSKPYADATFTAEVKQYAVGASPYAYAILGARLGASGDFILAAVGEYDAVFAATSSTTTAYENNGVYWYFYSPKSMGFAATSSVRLITADLLDNSETDSNRLSWHLDQPSNPSWRAGTAVGGSTYGYYKVVMYCN